MDETCENCRHYYRAKGLNSSNIIDYNDDYDYCTINEVEYYNIDDESIFKCDKWEIGCEY